MLALVLSTLMTLFLFYSYGTLFHKISNGSLTEKIFLGFAAAGTFLTLISLIFPLNFFVLVIMICVGAFIISMSRKEKAYLIKRVKSNVNVFLYSFFFVLIAFLTATLPQQVYDSGLYYLQYIEWINQYPAVPGLANLQGRFGFNSTSFLWNSLTSMKILFEQPVYSLNFSLLIIFILYFINKILVLYRKEGITGIVIFNVIIFGVILGMNNLISSPTPDFIATGLCFYVFSRFADLWIQKPTNFQSFLPLIIISLYLITIKLSTLPILILFLFPFLRKQRLIISPVKKVILSCIFILTPWLLRNVILSGWLIYPLPSLDLFDFDWKVPETLVIDMKQAITGWARVPGERYLWAANAAYNEWVPIWWNQLDFSKKLLFICGLIIPIGTLIYSLFKKKSIYRINPIIPTALIGVIFWFSMAPDFRFGKAFIVTAALSPLLVFNFSLEFNSYRKLPLYSIICLSLFFYAQRTWPGIKHQALTETFPFQIQKTQLSNDFEYSTVKMNSQRIFTPKAGDRCFDKEFPCTTPNVELNKIQMRGRTLRKGFEPHPVN